MERLQVNSANNTPCVREETHQKEQKKLIERYELEIVQWCHRIAKLEKHFYANPADWEWLMDPFNLQDLLIVI